jgi:hypothetical protein
MNSINQNLTKLNYLNFYFVVTFVNNKSIKKKENYYLGVKHIDVFLGLPC